MGLWTVSALRSELGDGSEVLALGDRNEEWVAAWVDVLSDVRYEGLAE